MKFQKPALFVLAALFSSVAIGNEVLVTVVDGGDQAKRGGSHTFAAIDVSASDAIAGFSFRVNVPGLHPKRVDLSKCVSDLPKGFDGKCSAIDGAVVFVAMSMSPDVSLPAGVSSVGSISFASASKSDGITVTELAMGTQDAQPVAAVAKIATESNE
jgi:hypothetical protein